MDERQPVVKLRVAAGWWRPEVAVPALARRARQVPETGDV